MYAEIYARCSLIDKFIQERSDEFSTKGEYAHGQQILAEV
jgi:hypothetical protein